LAEIPIDFEGVLATSRKLHDAVYKFLIDQGVPIMFATTPASLIALTVFVFLFGFAAVVQGVVGLGTFFATTILGVITKVRTDNAADFNQVIAAALSELLGYEISPDQFSAGKGPQGLNDRIASIGHALHDLLRSEFVSSGPITPDQGRVNAEKFSGFAINFATGSAFVSILTEAVSVGVLKEFRELGVETAQALGLGRLQRLAMTPLIRNAIQQPYDLYYRNLLRPDRLSEAQVVQAVRSGDMSDDEARQQLAEKGYRDQDINILLDQLSLKVQAGELSRLIRYGQIDQQKAIDALKTQGMLQEDAANLLKSIDESRADTQVSGMLADLEIARLGGFIDQAQLVGLVNDLPLGVEETDMFMRKVGRELERPRKTITFAQLKTAVIGNIVDFSYVDDWLRNEGYSDQDNTILTYEIIEALQSAEAKTAAKKQKAAQLQAAGKPVPPTLLVP